MDAVVSHLIQFFNPSVSQTMLTKETSEGVSRPSKHCLHFLPHKIFVKVNYSNVYWGSKREKKTKHCSVVMGVVEDFADSSHIEPTNQISPLFSLLALMDSDMQTSCKYEQL